MFEWFDLTVYAFFATTIARHFFPPGNEQAAMLSTAVTFGVAFLMRPLGAVVFGLIGDRRGRKVALTLSFAIMAVGTAMIAFAPTFAMAGVWATVILVTGRLLQGFSASGEIGASLAWLVESSASRGQGVATGWLNLGVYSALLMGSLAALAVDGLMSPQDAQSWGWRLPFVFGLLIAPLGLYLRSHMGESPEFVSAAATRAPVVSRAALREAVVGILKLTALSGFASPVVYLILVFMPGYATQELGLPMALPRVSTFVACLVLVALVVPMGRLCDRVGSGSVMVVSCAIGTGLIVPLAWNLMRSPSLFSLLMLQCTLSACLAAYASSCGPLAVRLFPVSRRALGVGLGYNLGVIVFGAFAPFVTAWWTAATGHKMVIAWYVFAGGLISLLVALSLRTAERLPARAESIGPA